MTPVASSTPIISLDEVIIARSDGTAIAASSETQKPTIIAAPPP